MGLSTMVLYLMNVLSVCMIEQVGSARDPRLGDALMFMRLVTETNLGRIPVKLEGQVVSR